MIERSGVVSGRAAERLPHIKRRLGGFFSKAGRAYIGVTNNPEARLEEHRAGKHGWAERMVLLYESEWRGSLIKVEKDLIGWDRCVNFQVEFENIGSGGEGVHREREQRWVYVLLDG